MKKFLAALPALLLLLTAACAAVEPSPEPSLPPPPEPTAAQEILPDAVISEAMAVNEATLADENGDFLPWVELLAGETPADLSGCVLTWGDGRVELENTVLSPGERRVVFFPAGSGFSPSAGGDTLRLTTAGGTEIDSLSCPGTGADESVCAGAEAAVSNRPSPGYENSYEGALDFDAAQTCPGPLAINEVMTYNEWYAPVDGEYYDWVEIKNVSDQPVELSGFLLSDSAGGGSRLPEGVLEPGGLILVLCAGDEDQVPGAMPFALDAMEERLYLRSQDGGLSDYTVLRDLPMGVSRGRQTGESGWFLFASPSPGGENSGGARGMAEAPVLLGEDGIFEDVDSVTVELSGSGEIHYTLDGSVPDQGDTLYTEPLTLTRTAVLRAVCVSPGRLNSESLDLSFIINEHHTFPVVSLVMDPKDLNGKTGIYSNPMEDWERPGAVMLYDDGGGFRLDCGVKLHGETSKLAQSKKSFKLNFRSRYDGELNYDLFENGVTSFSSILLRADQEEQYSTMMRDALMHTLAAECFPELPTQACRYSVLYLNGEYWGIYGIREAHSPEHYANHYGCDADKVSQWKERWEYGSFPDLIYDFAMSHDLSDDENYDYVASHVNIDSVIAWCIMETYSGNMDANSPNMRFYYSAEDDMLTYALVDLDLGMLEFQGYNNSFDMGYAYNKLASRLLSNYRFRDRYCTKLGEALTGTLSGENVISMIDQMEEELKPEIARNCKRWGNTPEVWERMVNKLRMYIRSYDVPVTMAYYTAQRLSLTKEEKEMYFGGVKSVPAR